MDNIVQIKMTVTPIAYGLELAQVLSLHRWIRS